MTITRAGALDLPVPVPADGETVSDPALDVLLAYLKTTLNTHASAAWERVKPPAGSLPVSKTFAHDPAEVVFNERDLPALYAYREKGEEEWIADDYLIAKSTLVLLWVFPPITQERQRVRYPFTNAIAKVLSAVFYRGRDPAFVLSGDTDPTAATLGSFVWSCAGFWKVGLLKWRTTDVTVEKGADRAEYKAVRFEVPIEERVLEGDEPALDSAIVDLTGTDDPDPTTYVEMQLDVP